MERMELPLGFGMALAQNEGAMQRFEALSEGEKAAVIEKMPQRQLETGNAAAGEFPVNGHFRRLRID